MTRGILVDGLPDTVTVSGRPYRINTDFRYGLNAAIALDDIELDVRDRNGLFVATWFSNLDIPEDFQGALVACSEFFLADEWGDWDAEKARRSGSATRTRSWDWAYDQELLIADFQREYGIDLTSARMHWWRFMALYRGLGDTSRIVRTVGDRTCRIPDDAPSEARKAAARRKAASALPPRTREEALEMEMESLGM